jgi:ABC-type glycerol-3-phosphate transport system substrate-binding protein
MVTAENKLFAAKFPDVKVTVVQIPADSLTSKLVSSAAARTGPDVVQNNPNVDMYQLGASGAVSDMTPYWNKFSEANQFPDSALWRHEGKIVAVQGYVNLLGIWYNQTILDSLGLKPATTVSELEAQLPKIKAAGYKGLMLDAAPNLDNATWQMYPWITAYGGDWCTLGGAGSVEVLTKLASWIKQGYIPTSATTWINQDITSSGFFDGKTAYVEDGNWTATAIKNAKLPFKFGATQVFAGPGGSHVLKGGEGWAIGGFTQQKQLAFDYITTAWLSKQGGQSSYEIYGVIPARKDVAPAAAADPILSPFVAAVPSMAAWPSASQANKAETNLSFVLSGIMAGQTSASEGAAKAAQQFKTDIASGTGSCSGS